MKRLRKPDYVSALELADAAVALAEAAVAWWEDHQREECHFCGTDERTGAHDEGCPVADYIRFRSAR